MSHNDVVDAMLAAGTYGATGRYRDPVSGRLFPRGMEAKHDPNRDERRRLRKWRRTGKVPKHAHCPVVPETPTPAQDDQ